MSITRGQEQLTDYIIGANLSFNSVTQVDIHVGMVRDSTDSFNIRWTSTLTADITSSGANGLDTGTEASDTFYAVHVIGDSTGVNATASLLSTSNTAPTLPSGYDVFRFVGWVLNNSASDFMNFISEGKDSELIITYATNIDDRAVLTAGSATTWAAVDLSSFVPTSSRYVYLAINWVNNAVAGDDLGFRPTGTTQITAPIFSPWRRQMGVGLSDEFRFPFEMVCDSNQSIDYETDTSNTVDISIIGYKIQR